MCHICLNPVTDMNYQSACQYKVLRRKNERSKVKWINSLGKGGIFFNSQNSHFHVSPGYQNVTASDLGYHIQWLFCLYLLEKKKPTKEKRMEGRSVVICYSWYYYYWLLALYSGKTLECLGLCSAYNVQLQERNNIISRSRESSLSHCCSEFSCHLLVVCPWASHLTPLSLSFFINQYNNSIKVHKVVRIKWFLPHKPLIRVFGTFETFHLKDKYKSAQSLLVSVL